ALGGAGSVAEIDQLLEAPSLDGGTLKDLLIPGSLARGTYAGQVCALNYVYTVYADSYSRRQFEDERWTPSTTWGDVVTLGEAAKGEDLALFPWGGQNASNYYQELALSMASKEAGVDLQKRLDSLEEGVFEDDALVAAYAAIEDAVKEGYFLSGDRKSTRLNSSHVSIS